MNRVTKANTVPYFPSLILEINEINLPRVAGNTYATNVIAVGKAWLPQGVVRSVGGGDRMEGQASQITG